MSAMAELRAAQEADIPRLMEIRAAVRENRLRNLEIGPDAYGPFVLDGRCWVREEGGIVRGFAALDADASSVWALFVDPASEGSGIGRALLDRLVTEARRRGLSVLTLETAAGTRAERLYLRAGWEAAGRDGPTLRLRRTL